MFKDSVFSEHTVSFNLSMRDERCLSFHSKFRVTFPILHDRGYKLNSEHSLFSLKPIYTLWCCIAIKAVCIQAKFLDSWHRVSLESEKCLEEFEQSATPIELNI